jgi:hypothetical protein
MGFYLTGIYLMADQKTSSDTQTKVPFFKRRVNPITVLLYAFIVGGSGYLWVDKNAEEYAQWLEDTPVLANSVEGRTRSGIAVESWVTETARNQYLCFMTKEAQVITCIREPKARGNSL